MSVALVFITHEGIASNLVKIGEAILQRKNNNLTTIEVPMDSPIEEKIDEIDSELQQLDIKDGMIFITDVYGSTPSNIAQQLASTHNSHLVSGVNLPMVIRLLNYRDESELCLLQKALDGAHQGIELKI